MTYKRRRLKQKTSKKHQKNIKKKSKKVYLASKHPSKRQNKTHKINRKKKNATNKKQHIKKVVRPKTKPNIKTKKRKTTHHGGEQSSETTPLLGNTNNSNNISGINSMNKGMTTTQLKKRNMKIKTKKNKVSPEDPDAEDDYKHLDKKIGKLINKSPGKYIKERITRDMVDKEVHKNLGIYLIGGKQKKWYQKEELIKKEIKHGTFETGAAGIQAITGSYGTKTANQKLFEIFFDEMPIKSIFKKGLENMRVYYKGNRIVDINSNVVIGGPGIYIYIAYNEDGEKKGRRFIGMIKVESDTAADKLQKKLKKRASRQGYSSQQFISPQQQMMMQQPMMQQPMMQQPMMQQPMMQQPMMQPMMQMPKDVEDIEMDTLRSKPSNQ
jgi:hypothetical protein